MLVMYIKLYIYLHRDFESKGIKTQRFGGDKVKKKTLFACYKCRYVH